MKSLSGKDLQGKGQRRWAQGRREVYRSILRSPGISADQKSAVKKRLEAASPRR